jgi:hypothetical protein
VPSVLDTILLHFSALTDLIALDNIIFERREKLRKLQEENGALKEQQTQILEHAKSGKLLRSFGTSSKRQESRQNPVAHRDDAGTVKRSQIVQAQPLDQSHSQMQNFATSPSAYAPRTSLSRARTLVETPPQVTLPSSASVVTFWSQTAQKYLSVVSLEPGSHEYGWLRSDAEEGSPLSMRGFNIIPIDGEWVALKSLGTSRFVEMIPATERLAWVVRATGTTLQQRHHFRIEGSGRMFNRQSRAYINVITDTPSNEVRGHGNAPHKSQASSFDDAGVDFQMRTLSSEEVRLNEQNVQNQAVREHKKEGHYIAQIKALPRSDEKRVVSYGLYGSNPKYTTGAIRNAELVHVYFPGWVTRFYCDSSVPKRVLDVLRGNGAEIVFIENIKGGIAGMFWRFLVADDPTVDRWIVRDSDSRLNPRERFAVEEWIQSGKAMHTIRDHPNHERPMNGGLIGGTKHAIPVSITALFAGAAVQRVALTFFSEATFYFLIWRTNQYLGNTSDD